jgi:16S rRNA (guanine966-N2)-methyltransferase
MRVVAGEAKGFRLRAPPGSETRPTSDKVREAIFAVLGDAVVGAHVLDLYAGTGALAIEALSRGAVYADLVERRATACQVIRQNLQHTRLDSRAHLWCMPVERFLSRIAPAEHELKAQNTYELVLADPPYTDPHIDDLMITLGGGQLLAPRAIVVLEHSPRFPALPHYGVLARWQYKIYGDTAVSFYEAQMESQ